MPTEQEYSPPTYAQLAHHYLSCAENAPPYTVGKVGKAPTNSLQCFLLGLASTIPQRVLRARFEGLREHLREHCNTHHQAERAIAALTEFLFYLES